MHPVSSLNVDNAGRRDERWMWASVASMNASGETAGRLGSDEKSVAGVSSAGVRVSRSRPTARVRQLWRNIVDGCFKKENLASRSRLRFAKNHLGIRIERAA